MDGLFPHWAEQSFFHGHADCSHDNQRYPYYVEYVVLYRGHEKLDCVAILYVETVCSCMYGRQRQQETVKSGSTKEEKGDEMRLAG